MKIIENSENNYRVVDYRGVGMATFYSREAAEEYIKLKEFVGEDIQIIMVGTNCAMPGTLKEVQPEYFVLDNRWSPAQYYDLSKLESFRAVKDMHK